MTPFLAAPSARRSAVTGALPGVIFPSAPGNTCGCSGDQTYNKCSVSRNDCAPGYYPECNEGPYNCGCSCKPG